MDRFLAEPGLSVSTLFTNRVMARVEVEPQARPVPWTGPVSPWWVEAWAEPAAALGLAALSLLTWQWTTVLSGVSVGLNSTARLVGSALNPSIHVFSSITGTLPVVTLTLLFGAVLAWGSLALFRTVEGWMTSSLITSGPTVPNMTRSLRRSR